MPRLKIPCSDIRIADVHVASAKPRPAPPVHDEGVPEIHLAPGERQGQWDRGPVQNATRATSAILCACSLAC